MNTETKPEYHGLKMNSLHYVQEQVQEMHKMMNYIQRKFDDHGIKCKIPSHVSRDLLRIHQTAYNEEQKMKN